jgi:hypothetical protein
MRISPGKSGRWQSGLGQQQLVRVYVAQVEYWLRKRLDN